MRLDEQWHLTRAHLERARTLLPDNLAHNPDYGGLAAHHDWLAHNELELAFDELEALGDVSRAGALDYDLALGRRR